MGTPDYFHECSFPSVIPENAGISFQFPRTGKGFAGIFTKGTDGNTSSNLREFIEIQLLDSLIQNNRYCISLFSSLADSVGIANSFGIHLSTDSFVVPDANSPNFTPSILIPPNPDKVNWTEFNFVIIAQGGEKFLSIGNFESDFNSDSIITPTAGWADNLSYYLIDDVSLINIEPKQLGGSNKKICQGDTAVIGMNNNPNYKYQWLDINGVIIDTTSFLTVQPANSTSYILKSTIRCECDTSLTTTIDTVWVEVILMANIESTYSICFGDSIQIASTMPPNLVYSWHPDFAISGANISNPYFYPSANQQYILTVSDSLLQCITRDTTVVYVIETANAGSDKVICLGNDVILGVGNNIGTKYTWSPKEFIDNFENGVITIKPTESTHFILEVASESDNTRCKSYDSVLVRVIPKPKVLTEEYFACKGDTIRIGPNSESDLSEVEFRWESSKILNPKELRPLITVEKSEAFSFVTYDKLDSLNCYFKQVVNINTDDCDSVFKSPIPNLITPNNDGKNDIFIVDINGSYTKFKGRILNRWGLEIYDWQLPSIGWNGKTSSGVSVPSGVYYYIVTVELKDKAPVLQKGFIQVIR